MVQVAAWFVAGVAWPLVFVATVSALALVAAGDVSDRAMRALWVCVAALMLSSGVAVAATAVALGVGQ